eukprot:19159-Heterococcus_DN1.PRE.1
MFLLARCSCALYHAVSKVDGPRQSMRLAAPSVEILCLCSSFDSLAAYTDMIVSTAVLSRHAFLRFDQLPAACSNGTAHTALLMIENVELKACGRNTTGFLNVHLHQLYSAAILRSCKQAARIS